MRDMMIKYQQSLIANLFNNIINHKVFLVKTRDIRAMIKNKNKKIQIHKVIRSIKKMILMMKHWEQIYTLIMMGEMNNNNISIVMVVMIVKVFMQ